MKARDPCWQKDSGNLNLGNNIKQPVFFFFPCTNEYYPKKKKKKGTTHG